SRDHSAENRAGSAEEGKRPRLEEPAEDAGEGACRPRGEIGGTGGALECGEEQALECAEAQGRTRWLARRVGERSAPRRIPEGGRACLRQDSGAGEAACGDRGQAK